MTWKVSALLLLVGATPLAGWAQAGPEATSQDRSNAAVYRRIEEIRRATFRMRVDGSNRDWRAVPRMTDPRGDAGGDSSRDIVAVAIAPTEDALWVMFRTAGKPSGDSWVFSFDVDMMGGNGDDFRIELESLQRGLVLRLFDKDWKPGERIPLRQAEAVVRHVVEMRIPYRDIAAAIPPDKGRLLSGEKARPWVRIRCLTWNADRQREVDQGPMVASFRLIETPYPLDMPLPPRPREPFALKLPVDGQWLISQGPYGAISHRNQWAYDLLRVDRNGYQSAPKHSNKNADHHAWGQPVFAPIGGRVVYLRSGIEDLPAGKRPAGNLACNQVSIDAGQGIGLNLLHFREDSVLLRPGERVTAGQRVGLVGNSGYSLAPHLHVALGQPYFRGRTIPLAFANVRVGLNAVPDDPWTRDLATWEPRFGYLVQSLDPARGPAPANTQPPRSSSRVPDSSRGESGGRGGERPRGRPAPFSSPALPARR